MPFVSTMTSSESEEQAPTRKRVRTSNSAEDGTAARGKKARGRPRVDTQDATAADRRRTQIRLAQRAYRQRKETTISSLKNQSAQLHSIIERMNKTFLQLNESALKSGLLQLNPVLAQQFKLVTETFSNLTRTASETQYVGDEDHAEAAENAGTTQQAQDSGHSEPEAQPIGWGYCAVADISLNDDTSQRREIRIETQPEDYFNRLDGAYVPPNTTNSLAKRRQSMVGNTLDRSRTSEIASRQPYQPQELPFGMVEILGQQQAPYTPPNAFIFSGKIPTPDTTPPPTRLPSPLFHIPSIEGKKVFSFDEPTFGRRLMRAALETGWQLLNRASVRPAALSYVFRLSLPFLSPDQLRARFKIMLDQSPYEDSELWGIPFIHLGGAGTHYPRRDANGSTKSLKNGWAVRQPGTAEKSTTRLQSLETGNFQDLDGLDLTGFEGEWFDPYDVEGYLEEQYSCKLDPKNSFAACLVEEIEDESPSNISQAHSRTQSSEEYRPPSLTHNSSISSSDSVTPPTDLYHNMSDTTTFGLDMSFDATAAPNFSSDLPKIMNYDISFDQTLGLDLAPGYDFGLGNMNDVGMGLAMMGGDIGPVPIGNQKRKKSAWVDVSRLIDEIVKHAVCLGRAPGFRRKDVDMALQKALVTAY